MMNASKATNDRRGTDETKINKSRRATFVLAVAGAIGLATQSRQARAELGSSQGDGAMPATIADKTGSLRKAQPQFQNLKAAGPEHQVVRIHYHKGAIEISTADGRNAAFPETDLRFKIDSSDYGPLAGKPVLLHGGMMGDRATLFFASPTEISDLIRRRG